MDPILCQIFKIILNISEKHEIVTNYPSIRIYINTIENTITFKIKTGNYLELLTPETMRGLGSTKKGENVSHLQVTEVVLVHCNTVNNDYQHDSRFLYTFVHNKSFG